MPKTASGAFVVKLLVKHFEFSIISQKGSHVKLKKYISVGELITIVPMHKELARGTLKGILRLARIEFTEFEPYLLGKKKK
ncbi:MAG: type II toxin-antitoxin system HicA family toxin [Candidatus Kerfeldbacteria bacterium]|nr:type II toxin-antitoxin system HicA family toxin [Candidatus Kerfeldbacteria bacterium]